MTQLVQAVIDRLTRLPESLQDRFAARFLKELEEVTPEPGKMRISGLGKGTIVRADDVDVPLSDSFWLGEE